PTAVAPASAVPAASRIGEKATMRGSPAGNGVDPGLDEQSPAPSGNSATSTIRASILIFISLIPRLHSDRTHQKTRAGRRGSWRLPVSRRWSTRRRADLHLTVIGKSRAADCRPDQTVGGRIGADVEAVLREPQSSRA